jgi:nicotinate-nucleotide pyrophosphorylase (carboxylating)
MNSLPLPELLLRPYIEAALREDVRSGDITSALVPAETSGIALMNFREAGVVAGIDLARLAFETLDAHARLEVLCADGTHVEPGTTVLRIAGRGAAMLTAERVALNFVQRLSGIATLTRQFVQAVAGTNVHIADTRKTTPGLRLLEKYAVRCGGGSNHRFALDDMVLIKDNHIALCGGIGAAVQRARESIGHSVKIEVECDTLSQVEQAVEAGVDIILLDNMTPQQMQGAVQKIRDSGQKILAEASGGINLQTVRAAAESGVDIISVGALTHSARALDVGLDIEILA